MQDIYKYTVRMAMSKLQDKRSFDLPEDMNPEFFVQEDRIPTFMDWMKDLKLKEAFKGLDQLFNRAQRGDMAVKADFEKLDGLSDPIADQFFFRGSNPNPKKLTKGYYLTFPFQYLYGQDKKVVKKMSPARQKLEDLFKKAASMEVEALEQLSPAASDYIRDLRALLDSGKPGRGAPGSALGRN